MKKELLLMMLPAMAIGHTQAEAKAKKVDTSRPNIIFILADDMGYGDVSGLNENSKINTPNLDRMVDNGVSFSDAHTSSAVSTPSRYGIMTGRYNWRSRLKSSVIGGYSRHLIPSTRTTMASLLKRADYNTACIGKWHLGWDWHIDGDDFDEAEMDTNRGWSAEAQIDYTKPIKNGPTELGFDYLFGFCGSLDMAPYVWVENDMPTAVPDHVTVGENGDFWRKGPTSPDFVHDEVLPTLTDKTIEYIQQVGKKKDPFFIYLPYPAPHTPILPTEAWSGKSQTNKYGDFVMFLDSEVGRILDVLEQMGIDDNTIVVFTADNGCSTTANFSELHALDHYPSYIWRGNKADLFEGGHRVPCMVQWPAVIEGGKLSNQTICLTDFFATFAEITGLEVAATEGEDSFSILKTFEDTSYSTPIRDALIHHSISGEFSIRVGDWKLLASPSSGGWSAPNPKHPSVVNGLLPAVQLYNLVDDPGEKNNLEAEYPEKVAEMFELLRKQIGDGRSTPGSLQSNEVRYPWTQLDPVFNYTTKKDE
ncbi:MAG: arylsulfatase [Rikenellaceae bacterium]